MFESYGVPLEIRMLLRKMRNPGDLRRALHATFNEHYDRKGYKAIYTILFMGKYFHFSSEHITHVKELKNVRYNKNKKINNIH